MGERNTSGNHDAGLLARCCAAGIGITATLGAAIGAIAHLRKVRPRRTRTMFGPAYTYNTRTASGEWLRMLVVNGGCQGATYHGDKWNHLPFAYFRSFDRMFDAGKHIERVLMIGGGGFTYPKHLLTRHPDVTMDVVEPDSAIISIAIREFHLDRLLRECPDRIRVVETGGMEWLSDSQDLYDAIINDAFVGSNVVRDLVLEDAVAAAKRHLTPGGLYLTNVVTFPEDGDYSHLSCATEALEKSFEYVQVIPTIDEEFSDEENYLVIASDTPLDFEDAIGC